jgi:hypothetical protein
MALGHIVDLFHALKVEPLPSINVSDLRNAFEPDGTIPGFVDS